MKKGPMHQLYRLILTVPHTLTALCHSEDKGQLDLRPVIDCLEITAPAVFGINSHPAAGSINAVAAAFGRVLHPVQGLEPLGAGVGHAVPETVVWGWSA